MTPLSFSLVSSPFGTLTLLWQDTMQGPKVQRVLFPHTSRPAGAQEHTCPTIADLTQQESRFFEGVDVQFPLEILALETCSPFQRRVLIAEYQIPRSRVSTYGLIARYLGVDGGARAVGNALARNPFPILIPCHRAVRTNGQLGGYQGGLKMKRALLEMEGIRFHPAGRAITEAFYYASPRNGKASCQNLSRLS